jgi:hypothetical protein
LNIRPSSARVGRSQVLAVGDVENVVLTVYGQLLFKAL